jgi:transcriptional regulator with XRE-family HTH domain
LDLAQADVAKNTGVTKQAYAQFEQGETKGTLSLGSLQRAAEAMDCDLVYYLVPRAKSFGKPAPRPDPAPAPPPTKEHPKPLADQPASDLPAHLL